MATLTCRQCNYVNEGERIYCHQCGAKLDRSVLPTEPDRKPGAADAERRRVQKLVSPSRGFFAGFGKTLLSTVLCSLLAASSVQMLRPPREVPPVIKAEDALAAEPLPFAIEDAMQKITPQRLAFSTDAINRYLAGTIKSKPSSSGGLGTGLTFVRSFVNCDQGVIRITNQQSVLGYSLYATSCYQLAIKENHLVATNVGGAMGRMPIHPEITAYADTVFQQLWDALKREHKLLDGLQAIEVIKGAVVLTTKPRV